MLRKNLIAKIHIGKSQLGLDDETYRQLLVSTTGKTSFVHWLQPWQLKKVVQMLAVYDRNKKAL